MASIEKRGTSYRITVCLGTDIYGKKLFEKITFRPAPGLTPANLLEYLLLILSKRF